MQGSASHITFTRKDYRMCNHPKLRNTEALQRQKRYKKKLDNQKPFSNIIVLHHHQSNSLVAQQKPPLDSTIITSLLSNPICSSLLYSSSSPIPSHFLPLTLVLSARTAKSNALRKPKLCIPANKVSGNFPES